MHWSKISHLPTNCWLRCQSRVKQGVDWVLIQSINQGCRSTLDPRCIYCTWSKTTTSTTTLTRLTFIKYHTLKWSNKPNAWHYNPHYMYKAVSLFCFDNSWGKKCKVTLEEVILTAHGFLDSLFLLICVSSLADLQSV